MNKNICISVLALALAAGAQAASPFKANIPFEFGVRGVTLPAGAYTVDLRVPDTVSLRSADGHGATVFTQQAQLPPSGEGGKLVFRRIGDRYFLGEVWATGAYGRLIPQSAQERKLARRGTSPDVIVAGR